MDQEAAIQAVIDHHQTSTLARKIFETYMRSPEGRTKLAHSMIHPARILVEYLGSDKVNLSSTDLTTRVDDYKRFLAAVSDKEKVEAPYPELQGYVKSIEEFLNPPA